MSVSLSAIRSEVFFAMARSGSYYRDSQLVQVQRVSEYRMLSPKWTSLTPPSSQGTGNIKEEWYKVRQSQRSVPTNAFWTRQNHCPVNAPSCGCLPKNYTGQAGQHCSADGKGRSRESRTIREDTGCWWLWWEGNPCRVARALMDVPHQCAYGQH